MNESRSDRRPLCGIVSLAGLAAVLALGSVAVLKSGQATGVSHLTVAGGVLAGAASIGFAIASTVRDEKPAWPALVGLVLSIFPGLWMLWKLLESWSLG
jgi:hypothetical protein